MNKNINTGRQILLSDYIQSLEKKDKERKLNKQFDYTNKDQDHK